MTLILSIATILLAAGLALALQIRALSLSQTEHTALRSEAMKLAASEAIRAAMMELAADPDLECDHLGEDWAAPIEGVTPGGIAIYAITEDAGRWFNWNNLTGPAHSTRMQQVILDIMAFCGDFNAISRIDALIDWLDDDEDGPFESAFYQTQTPAYPVANRPLWSPAELLRVHGFSLEYFREHENAHAERGVLSGNLSASTTSIPSVLEAPAKINLNTASATTLLGIFGLENESVVQMALAFRSAQPIESMGTLLAAYPELASRVDGIADTKSSFFKIRAHAFLEGMREEATAWVERDTDGNVHILQWIWGAA